MLYLPHRDDGFDLRKSQLVKVRVKRVPWRGREEKAVEAVAWSVGLPAESSITRARLYKRAVHLPHFGAPGQ
jgi:hypothetical protein